MAYVVVFAEGAEPQRFPLNGLTVVGRALGCQIWLDDKQLSRKHCKIEPVNGQWMLTDLDSRNGTFLERDHVRRHVLRDGDSIYIGSARIHFHASPQVTSHRPSDPTEASHAPTVESKKRSSEDTHVPNTTMPRRRLPTAVLPSRGAEPSTPEPVRNVKPKEGDATSLAFARPRARPMVEGEQPKSGSSSGAGGMSSSWFSAVVSRLRRSR